jgi:hypothetical protein
MTTRTRKTTQFLRLAVVMGVALGAHAEAQERAGVVTALEGKVTVTRASLPAPTALKFKDDILVKDSIATGQDSVARILLGGRAVVTVRERSVVTITEVPGVSTVDVVAGRAAVAVAREKMRPGDLVEVKTPNAVAGIRGTVIVAEVFDAHRSAITVLKGVIDVTRLDGGRPTVVTALQRVTVIDQAPVSVPQKISPDAANVLRDEFRVAPPRTAPPAAAEAITKAEVDRTAKYFASIPSVTAPAVASQAVASTDHSAAVSADDDQAATDSEGKSDRADKGGRGDKADKSDKAGRGNDKATPTSKTATALTPVSSSGSTAASSAPATPVSSAPVAPVASAPVAPVTAVAPVAPVTTVSTAPVATMPSLSSVLQAVTSGVDSGKNDRKGKRDR